MKWQLNVPQGTNKLQLDAELICRTHQMEQIRITGKNISCILISNRPLIEAIERLHPISISWRVFGGELKDEQLVSSIGKELEKNLSVKNQKNVELFTQMLKTA